MNFELATFGTTTACVCASGTAANPGALLADGLGCSRGENIHPELTCHCHALLLASSSRPCPETDAPGTCIECRKVDPQAVTCRNDGYGGIQILYCQGPFVQNYNECICSDDSLWRAGAATCAACPAKATCDGSRVFTCIDGYKPMMGRCVRA